jgi:DNA-binding response OmpR family regulator
VRLLVVEDDARIAAFIVKGLQAEGYVVLVAATAATAEQRVWQEGAALDLMLLDLGLPGGDGQELLRRLRQRGVGLPIIVVTARADVASRVRGLDAGANDYVTKPFAFEELLARIRAATRAATQTASPELEVGDLRLDLVTKVAWRAGRRIELAPREWALLELFLQHPTAVLSRAKILSSVWRYEMDPSTNVVDVYVGYLRKKINIPGSEPMIHTIRGAGYRLVRP